MSVCVIDTSVFCEILDVPRMADRSAEILAELVAKLERHEQLILPMATILETGNHIGQNGDPDQRFATAGRFVAQVEKALRGETPFRFSPLADNQALAARLESWNWLGHGGTSAGKFGRCREE